jgi:hypothetical protein
VLGLDILGADPVKAPDDSSREEFGPLSPEQLEKLDRALTPAEYKAVYEWRASQSAAAQVKEEAKPFIDPRTGKLTKLAIRSESETQPAKRVEPVSAGMFVIIGGAIIAVFGAVLMLRKKRRR